MVLSQQEAWDENIDFSNQFLVGTIHIIHEKKVLKSPLPTTLTLYPSSHPPIVWESGTSVQPIECLRYLSNQDISRSNHQMEEERDGLSIIAQAVRTVVFS